MYRNPIQPGRTIDPVRALKDGANGGFVRQVLTQGDTLRFSNHNGVVNIAIDEAAQAPYPQAINSFFAKIQDATYDATLAGDVTHWKYKWVLVFKATPGYGGWLEQPANASGDFTNNPARNTMEDANQWPGMTPPIIAGGGVDLSHLPSGYALKPISKGSIVRMWFAEGSITEVWFAESNVIDGVCSG